MIRIQKQYSGFLKWYGKDGRKLGYSSCNGKDIQKELDWIYDYCERAIKWEWQVDGKIVQSGLFCRALVK